MHELLITGKNQRRKGIKTLDLAKRLLDRGYYAPTVYFPITVEEAMLIEPTESESKQTIDAFCDAMLALIQETNDVPELVLNAPVRTPVSRVDEAQAARHPILRWES